MIWLKGLEENYILNLIEHLFKKPWFFEEIDWHLLSKDKVKEVLNEFGANKYCTWYYYNTKFKICLFINLFFWEYIYAIIGKDNIKYIDIGDIDKHVDYILEDIMPDY